MLGDFVDTSGNKSLNTVTGQIELKFHFETASIDGGGHLDVSNARWAEFAIGGNFAVNDAQDAIAIQDATLDDPESDSYGNLEGYFFGSNAEEAAGVFEYFKPSGTAAGVWTSQKTNTNPTSANIAIISTQTTPGWISDTTASIDNIPTQGGTPTTISLPNSVGGGTVTTTQVLSDNGYNYASWGRWGVNQDTPSGFQNDGYWVAGELTTPSQMTALTGTATYSGQIMGDHVNTTTGVRSAATGSIALQANFDTDSITGSLQFDGPNGNASSAALQSGISNDGRIFQSANDTSKSWGFNGAFVGPTANEVAGAAWLREGTDSYNGVFRAQQ